MEAKCSCSVVRHRTQITDKAFRERWLCKRCGAEFTRDTFEDVREWSREKGRRLEKCESDRLHVESELARARVRVAELEAEAQELRDAYRQAVQHLYARGGHPALIVRRDATPPPPAVDPREEDE